MHYPGKVLAPSCLGQKWEQRISCVVWDRTEVQFTDTDSLWWSNLSPFPTISFLLFFYSLINTGNELHMAMAFTSLCEICSSCIVYQFNMFTTDAISVWQLSCLKSPFPPATSLPSLPVFFPTCIIATWFLFQADATLQQKDQICQWSECCVAI